ncbi:Phosphorylated CTD-interacting factor 1 [Hondaea fermentalgiana]|uniref:Phosphorylated CTD-interacting factor 1 n=1 Tax=Hondaea fermentalgiana TaxID=2315210 RepID=A0A2R5GNG2_9STRA|nr:Phosphorylated CTD-interacting factor 1 [Hondaea fermentalgiana]|eukprot:GBG29404.1 Phosphorylated CTD-interacting factor 1 [Hondaea fermentalgiana]
MAGAGDELSQLMASFYEDKPKVAAAPKLAQQHKQQGRAKIAKGTQNLIVGAKNAKRQRAAPSANITTTTSGSSTSSTSSTTKYDDGDEKEAEEDASVVTSGAAKRTKTLSQVAISAEAKPNNTASSDPPSSGDDAASNWDEDDEEAGYEIDVEDNAPPQFTDSFPAKEVWLRGELRKLHFRLEKALSVHLDPLDIAKLPLQTKLTLRNGDALWHRWIFAALESSAETHGVLPDEMGLHGAESVIRVDLEGMSGGDAAILDFSSAAAKLIANAKPPAADSKQGRRQHVTLVRAKRANGEYKLRYRSEEVTVRPTHLMKLAQTDLEAEHGARELESQEFLRAAFCVLMRYETFGGAGFQAALPDATFHVLKEDFHVEEECFASPLNKYYAFNRFCSLFPDTDSAFGSRGSFFYFRPIRGCFEVNPPFATSTVMITADRIGQLLTDAAGVGESLAFIVIVPARYADLFEKSGFHRRKLIVPNRQHNYKQGAQHRAKSRTSVASTTDTAIHILQTDAANAKWPLDENMCQRLLASFQTRQ